ncbi:hypothetical protein SAMN02927900_01313 [Rhizobium mongolense subsp. loessense]|uniref:Uncharacterized protein n=1 Tax=Rhizobium mongolense subsp. loessense TaxID=158890 RepID=A0A1G4Q3U1_9HYPH|nr:hypothetical protein [Rhizobium mongolense]SCW39270.1 hypothetical protein SAMN02927900_01313 [Rhizobium mongolense subsp. loessense]
MDLSNKPASWQKVKIAGRQFWRIPHKEFSEMMNSMFPNNPRESDGADFLMPCFPDDDKRDFPTRYEFEDAGPLIASGIARHSLTLEGISAERSNRGLSARHLSVFNETDWYGECFGVLEAHGWTTSGNLTPEILAKVEEIEGKSVIDEAKQSYGENWEIYLMELAAQHLAKPLSRLWYAANMKSLYYCHHDDLRLGFLWAEYQMKMQYESFALKHMEVVERNSENGKKGGQGAARVERYRVLDQLVMAQGDKLAFSDNDEIIKAAKKLAMDYDRQEGAQLFQINNKSLGPSWYKDWVGHYRSLIKAMRART